MLIAVSLLGNCMRFNALRDLFGFCKPYHHVAPLIQINRGAVLRHIIFVLEPKFNEVG